MRVVLGNVRVEVGIFLCGAFNLRHIATAYDCKGGKANALPSIKARDRRPIWRLLLTDKRIRLCVDETSNMTRVVRANM